MQTKEQTGFINPYLALATEELKRTNTEIAETDWNLLRSVRVSQGTFTTANNILIKKLCDECRRLGYTDMSRHQEFERFVAGLHLVSDEDYQRLCHSTSSGVSGRGTDGRDVSGTAPSESGGDSQPEMRAAVVPQTSTKKRVKRGAAVTQETQQS